MSRTLRYQISDWTQITDCLSNNNKNLFLTLSKHLDGNTLRSLVLQVRHPKYGVLFAAAIQGSGTIISDEGDDGNPISFLTTEQILEQIAKFGFYVKYDIKSNLPNNVLDFIATLEQLGFEKLTRVVVDERISDGTLKKKPQVICFKNVPENENILIYGCRLSAVQFDEKLRKNIIMNITKEPDMDWDWLTYMVNISDIINENIDPTDDYETLTDADYTYNFDYTGQSYPSHMNSQGFYSYEGNESEG